MIDASTMSASKQANKERKKSLVKLTEAQAALGWVAVLLIMGVLGYVYLNQASKIATVGRRVQSLQAHLDEARRVNASTERSIAQEQSLERLRMRSAELGFAPAQPGNIEYLVVTGYPQENASGPAPLKEEGPLPVDTLSEAIAQTFRARMDDLVRGESQ
jgi:hypothetical protein